MCHIRCAISAPLSSGYGTYTTVKGIGFPVKVLKTSPVVPRGPCGDIALAGAKKVSVAPLLRDSERGRVSECVGVGGRVGVGVGVGDGAASARPPCATPENTTVEEKSGG